MSGHAATALDRIDGMCLVRAIESVCQPNETYVMGKRAIGLQGYFDDSGNQPGEDFRGCPSQCEF